MKTKLYHTSSRSAVCCCVKMVIMMKMMMAIVMMMVVLMPLSVSSTCLTCRSQDRSSTRADWLANGLDRQFNPEPARSEDCGELNWLAVEWVDVIDSELGRYLSASSLAEFRYTTNLTGQNERQFENVRDRMNTWSVDNLPAARELHKILEQICNSTARRLISLFVNLNLPPVADDPQTNRAISHLTNEMSNIYSTAVVTDDSGQDNRLDPELTNIIATSRDYEKLKWAWQGWRDATGPKMKPLYAQLVDKMNEAAIDNGNMHGDHARKRCHGNQA